MSEKLLKVFLAELTLLRVCCKNSVCGAVLEMPIDQVTKFLYGGKCPVCQASLKLGNDDHFAMLAKAIQGLVVLQDKVEVAFVLKDDGA